MYDVYSIMTTQKDMYVLKRFYLNVFFTINVVTSGNQKK